MPLLLIILIITLYLNMLWKNRYKPYIPEQTDIYLYGEVHGREEVYEKEFQIWKKHYDRGIRDLFVEMPYYTAQYLNIFMQSEDNEILDTLYDEIQGSVSHIPAWKELYMRIRSECPETVFHGIDIGHAYASTGKRYTEYVLREYGENSKEYIIAENNRKEGIHYYASHDEAYRENCMVSSFEREYSGMTGNKAVGFFGLLHCDPRKKNITGQTDNLARQLQHKYGDVVAYELAAKTIV